MRRVQDQVTVVLGVAFVAVTGVRISGARLGRVCVQHAAERIRVVLTHEIVAPIDGAGVLVHAVDILLAAVGIRRWEGIPGELTAIVDAVVVGAAVGLNAVAVLVVDRAVFTFDRRVAAQGIGVLPVATAIVDAGRGPALVLDELTADDDLVRIAVL